MAISLCAPRPSLAGLHPWRLPLMWSRAHDDGAPTADERQAFEARMSAAWPGVVRLVERLLAWPESKSDVEDVAQEAFLAAWRGRGTFRGEAAWSTWVHTIALRHARNAARSRERRQRWFGRLLPGAEFDALPVDDAEHAASAEEAVSSRVRDGLKRLRHADREVLVLRYLEGLSVEEIAGRLQLERAAVDARLSRARARMRPLIEQLDDAGGAR